MTVFRTYIIKAAAGPTAVAITDALGYPEKGMFTSKVADAGTTVGYVSSGIVDDDSPLNKSAAELLAALTARKPGHGITLAQCQAFKDALDQTDAEPFPRMDLIRKEIKASLSAQPWVQPQGTVGMYALDAVVTDGGYTWISTIKDNVWRPGTSGWRRAWTDAAQIPDYVHPTGAHDMTQQGAVVRFRGQVWEALKTTAYDPTENPADWKRRTDLEGGQAPVDPPAGDPPWVAGESVKKDDRRTYGGKTYKVIQVHKTQVGWEPPNVPALWGVVA